MNDIEVVVSSISVGTIEIVAEEELENNIEYCIELFDIVEGVL